LTVTGGKLSIGHVGLVEGLMTGAFNTATPIPNQGHNLSTTRANSTSNVGFPNDSTWGYEGKFFVPGNTPVTWNFAENFDDNVLLRIDGAIVLNDTTWNNPTSMSVVLNPGAHDIELRVGQGGGGVGPVGGILGVGYDVTGLAVIGADLAAAGYVALTDPGDGSFLYSTDTLTLANNIALNVMTEVSVGQPGMVTELSGAISGTGLEKTGGGTLHLSGVQTYTTLTTTGGITEVDSALATGATVNANATTNFNLSQTLSALNIGAGAVVTLTATPPFAPLAGAGSAVVPEPGTVGLLLVGALGVLARRRRS